MNYKQLDPLKLGWICLFGLATSISLKSHPQLDSDHWQIQTRIFFVLLNNKEKHVKFSCIICYLDRQISFSCINYFPRLLSSIRNLRTCDTGETFFFFLMKITLWFDYVIGSSSIKEQGYDQGEKHLKKSFYYVQT